MGLGASEGLERASEGLVASEGGLVGHPSGIGLLQVFLKHGQCIDPLHSLGPAPLRLPPERHRAFPHGGVAHRLPSMSEDHPSSPDPLPALGAGCEEVLDNREDSMP